MAGVRGYGGAGAGRFAGAGGMVGAGGGAQGEPLRVTIDNPNATKQNVSDTCVHGRVVRLCIGASQMCFVLMAGRRAFAQGCAANRNITVCVEPGDEGQRGIADIWLNTGACTGMQLSFISQQLMGHGSTHSSPWYALCLPFVRFSKRLFTSLFQAIAHTTTIACVVTPGRWSAAAAAEF